MSEKELKLLLKEAYYAGKDNATNRTDKNLNDFLQENKERINNYLYEENQKEIHERNLPFKDDVIDTVINAIDIKGIELENYKIQIVNSTLYQDLNSLYCDNK